MVPLLLMGVIATISQLCTVCWSRPYSMLYPFLTAAEMFCWFLTSCFPQSTAMLSSYVLTHLFMIPWTFLSLDSVAYLASAPYSNTGLHLNSFLIVLFLYIPKE